MQAIPQIPTPTNVVRARFAGRLRLFYAGVFGIVGAYLPFFTVWLKAVGIDSWWIGVITAVPSVTRFTVLPFITTAAERYRVLRGAMVLSAFLTTAGFLIVGTQQAAAAVFVIFVAVACAWTPMVPLTDAYALRGVAAYGLDYGPLRVWGSVAFVVGALICGALADILSPTQLIWVIASVAGLAFLASLGLQPLATPSVDQTKLPQQRLLRDIRFLTVIVAAAFIQGSHAAYYTFASIEWRADGLGGTTIAILWVLGVAAEIVVFALSPRFVATPATLMMIGAGSAVLRWLLYAQQPSLLSIGLFQLMHGLTFGLTQVGTMSLLISLVPGHRIARAQGYLTAATGMAMSSASILSGVLYSAFASGVYYAMAALAVAGFALIWLMKPRLSQPVGLAPE